MKTIKDPYGFIYITTNLINGKKYIGQKKFDSTGAWKSYLGSGVVLKQAISIYGKENFKKNIIYISYDKETLDKVEKEYIELFDAVKSTDYYNIAAGGEGYDYFSDNNHYHSVYCKELNCAFKNSRIASEVTGENSNTIYNKCKNYNNNLKNVKSGYHWCFIEDMYSIYDTRQSSQGVPVVSLKDNKVYNSTSHAQKSMKSNHSFRRKVLSIEEYNKYILKNKNLDDRFLKLVDFFELFDHTA